MGMGFSPGQTSRLIAIIDDDEASQDSLCDLIEAAGFEARCFGSTNAFLDSDLHGKAACLIVDIDIPRGSGMEPRATLKEEKCNVPIIFITTFEDTEIRTQAMREGAVELLIKPIDHRLLLKTLHTALDVRVPADSAER